MSGTTFDWRKLLDSAPLPFYQDTQAGTGATQQTLGGYPTAQDTGGTLGGWTRGDFTPRMEDGPGSAFTADWSGASGQVPYSAPSTTGGATGAGQFGYDYSGAAPGYNAWALYNGGTQDGGWYNAAADTQQWDAGRGNGTAENSRDRVWRWTLDDLKAQGLDPGKAPIDVVNRAFLNNVARVHRDFDANGYNWQQSGFANFDRVLPAGAAGTSGGTGSAGGGTAGGSTGGTGVSAPLPYGQGAAAGAAAAGATTQPGGNPLNGGQGGMVNSAGGIDQLYQNDRAYRTAQLLKALGLGDINSRLSYGGSVVAKQAPGLFEAWREAQGIGGGGVPNGMDQLGAFAKTYNAPGALGNIAQTGQGALDWIMKQGGQGLSDEELIPLIQGFENLANIRQSDTMNRYYGNLTDQGLGQFLQGIGPNNLTARLVPYLQNNPLFGFLTGKR
jgi:hypothetical protein